MTIANEAAGRHRRRSRARRIGFALALLAGALLLAEAGTRGFWAWRGVPFLRSPERLHLAFYPELRPVEQRAVRRDEIFDILLLGGSAVSPQYGSIAEQLAEQLVRRWRRRVIVHCVGARAHTTRDSYYKYRHLGDKSFDLVIVYHGINDVRANNCPPELFRADYAHWGWYAVINQCEALENPFSALPFTVSYGLTGIALRLGLRHSVPAHAPRADWIAHGANVKTAATFRANVDAIGELARARGEPVLLATFASHVPPDYTAARFAARDLDYALHLLPLELWGAVDNVTRALAAHNAELRDAAARHQHVHLVDLAELMPRGGAWFNDACHFTHVGCTRFVELVVEAIDRDGLGPQ